MKTKAAMSFAERYELLDLIAEGEARTHLAREASTVRMVMVHQLLPGPNRISLLELVLRLRMSGGGPAGASILDLGEHEGTPYVVTEIIHGFHALREWLQAELSAAPTPAGERPGWPPAPPPPPPLSAKPAPPPRVSIPEPPPAAGRPPGDFTKLYRAVMSDVRKAPEAPRYEPPPAPAPAPVAAPRVESQRPAEPVRVPPPPEPPRPAPPPVEPPPAAPPVAPPVAPQPGEFTKLFRSPLGGAPPPPPPVSAPGGPGEFTRMFQSPLGGSPPAGAPAPPSSLQPEQPGEFTRMFQSPVAAGPPGPESPAAGPPPSPPPAEFPPAGFGVPPPAPMGPPPARGGEFTRLFGPGAGAPEPAAPQAFTAAPRGGATELFTTPTVPPPAPMPPAGGAGPGEFTRMVGASPPPVEAVPTQSPAPGLAAPKPVVPPGARSNLPLFLIAGFALLVVIALMVYFLALR